jgi:Ni/Co efflux regulator RcnB
MRKLALIAALLATCIPAAASAQHHRGDHRRADVRHDRHEVRRDQRQLRGDRHELRGDRHELRRDRRVEHRRARYVAPYRGWSYRPLTVGYRLRPAFYAPRYYVSDWGAYHVRAPGRWERWIQYGNDLLLVNVRTGRVLLVVHNRYW